MDKYILKHFSHVDPTLYRVAKEKGIIPIQGGENPFCDLCSAIVCQQLSDKAGTAIWKKFEALFPSSPTPSAVLEKSVEALRTSGVSQSKAQYIQNIAKAFIDGTVEPKKFSTMTDEDIIAHLVVIKGIGRWTAEMFLIFSLGRPDVFSCGDLGLRKGVQKLYRLKNLPEEKQLLRMTKKWSPYRSYASLLLWKSLD